MFDRRGQGVDVSQLGAVPVAFAQAQGGRGGPTGTTGAGRSGEGGALVLFGTPGNCPPTRACADEERQRQPRRDGKAICTRWEMVTTANGRRIRKCIEW